jgi:Flp pilus assembly protein TadD
MQELFNQAQNLHQQGQLPKAEQIYRQILDKVPGQPLVCARLAMLLQQTGRAGDALPLLSLAIKALPQEFDLLMQGVSVATALGENVLAEHWLRQAIELKPKSAEAHEQLAGVLIACHKEKEALQVCKTLIKLAPKNANAYNLKGLALSRLGDTDKGYSSFQKSLKLNPGQIAVIRNLILYGKGRKEPLLDNLIPQLEDKVSLPQQAPPVRMNIAYILSMYYERAKNTAKAFRYLKLGNDINRQSNPYEHQQTEQQFALLTEAFDKALLSEIADKALDDASPIFILGMPRSGTTLIEQILSSHSEVGAEGEIIDLRDCFTKHEGVLNVQLPLGDRVAECIASARDYIDRVRERQNHTYFTDKMPYNFMLVGLILAALPKAKIIHCTRDPLETCFSIYKQNFAGSHSYTNELTELGQYYNSYRGLMSYWEGISEGRIYEANYEAMVDDSEAQISQLLAYCGLESQEACFEFHKNKRAVRTASVAQVRQPIYKDAMKASTPYAKQLAPLAEELNKY